MKARIFEIKRFAVHDGNGIRTTVFFKGCPLKCVWCHNPEGIDTKPQLSYYQNKCVSCGQCVNVCPGKAHSICGGAHIFDREKCIPCGKCEASCLKGSLKLYGREMTVSEVMQVLLYDSDFYEISGGGVTLSGGECLMQADFCSELLESLKQHSINTAVDTCGFVSKEVLDKVMPFTDVFLYDLKAFDEDVHIKCTGQSNKVILENLKYIDECGKNIEIRIPYVPDYNSNQIEKMAKVLCGLRRPTKVKILPYHNYAGSKYKSLDMDNTLPETLPTKTELECAVENLRKKGINAFL